MRLLSFSPFVPWRGIPHAGGEFYRRYLEAAVELGWQVTVVAPRTELNLNAMKEDRPAVDVVLLSPRHLGRFVTAIDRVGELLLPHLMAWSMRRAIIANPAIRRLASTADVVEAHWEEMSFALLRIAKPTLLVLHDIASQREQRWLRAAWTARAVRKTIWRAWRTSVIHVTERRSLRRADVILTLSEKDTTLARRVSRQSNISHIDPPLWDGSASVSTARRGRTVIFVAAFSRRENVEAAIWLLEEVWPLVRQTVPDAMLLLVGGGPPAQLMDCAQNVGGVSVTGYVDDLEAYYARAAVAVVPLHSGAGVKFKTIDALVRGVAVVATTVGAEGIEDDDGETPFDTFDEPAPFAGAVISRLLNPGQIDAETTRWARERYGVTRFRQRLGEVLGGMAAAAP